MTSAIDGPPAGAFVVEVHRGTGVDVVTARGELDLSSAVRLRHVLFDPVLCSQPLIALDLDQVTFLDSTGIGTLVAARRWTRSRDARFVIVCGDGPALRVLQLVGLHRVMEIVPSLDVVLDEQPGQAG